MNQASGTANGRRGTANQGRICTMPDLYRTVTAVDVVTADGLVALAGSAGGQILPVGDYGHLNALHLQVCPTNDAAFTVQVYVCMLGVDQAITRKWVKVQGWDGPEAARQEILSGIESYRKAAKA